MEAIKSTITDAKNLYQRFLTNIGNLKLIAFLGETDESRQNYSELITVLARIAACTPNSVDVDALVQTTV